MLLLISVLLNALNKLDVDCLFVVYTTLETIVFLPSKLVEGVSVTESNSTLKIITPRLTTVSAISREFFLISSKVSPNPSLAISIMTHPRST